MSYPEVQIACLDGYLGYSQGKQYCKSSRTCSDLVIGPRFDSSPPLCLHDIPARGRLSVIVSATDAALPCRYDPLPPLGSRSIDRQLVLWIKPVESTFLQARVPDYSRPALAFTFIRTFTVNAARPIMTPAAEMDTMGTAAVCPVSTKQSPSMKNGRPMLCNQK